MFWIQLLGLILNKLICLIENTSFHQLISKLNKFIKPKIKNIKIGKKVIKTTMIVAYSI